MLSFIHMGGRKGRPPRRKNSRKSAGTSTRAKQRTSRGSASFSSPGNVGEITEKPTKVILLGDSRGNVVTDAKGAVITTSLEVPCPSKRSPEIQMEFKHASLLQTLPEEFLKHRKASSSSSVQHNGSAKLSSQAAASTSNLDGSPQGRRLTQEKRRMGPLPGVSPIKIPSAPLKTIATASQLQQHNSHTRRSGASNTFGWASDSEPSPVSGLSAARDVIAESFAFSSRAPAFLETSEKEKEVVSRGLARQDSATLPKEAVWDGAMLTPSMSRRSSSQSAKKRKRDTNALDIPPFDVALLASPLLRVGEPNERVAPIASEQNRPSAPPRKDSMLGHRSEGSGGKGPPPPGLTPSAQKLDQVDQAALHRISRVLETDAEVSSTTPGPPASGSTMGSFSIKSKKSGEPTVEALRLQSLIKCPSVLSTPSTYSKHSDSPYASPGKRPAPLSAGASSSKSDYGYESFLEDFEFIEYVDQSPGQSSHGDRNGFSGNAGSPSEPQVPVTAARFNSLRGLKYTPSAGSFRFPQDSSKSNALQKPRSTKCRTTKRGEPAPPSIYSNPSPEAKSSIISGRSSNHATSGKVKVTAASTDDLQQTTVHPDVRAGLPDVSVSRSDDPGVRNGVDEPAAGRRRPAVDGLCTTNPGPPSPGESPQSPDLLDMLIPDGHIVTPISRRQIEGKRSRCTPSPIKIGPSRSARYLPLNGDEDDDAVTIEVRDSCLQSKDVPDIQTFPETPALFSPDVPKDAVSPSNSVLSNTQHQGVVPPSLLRNALTLQPIVIPSTPLLVDPTKVSPPPSAANDRSASTDKDEQHPDTLDPSTTPPLQPSPDTPLLTTPKTQTLSDAIRPSPPLLGPVPVNKKRTVHVRPPLPFGPRKPSLLNVRGTAPLSFAPRRAASESAAVIVQGLKCASLQTKHPETPLSTPAFKTTPVPWRSLTLDAAKWTFSSAQLQAIVRVAIEQSAQASSIRILPPDVSEKLPSVLSDLVARRNEVQKNYKVIVRRRRSIIQRLSSLSSTGLRNDASLVMRDAEELEAVTAAGDKLVEELHDVDDQIAQVHRLQDVHQASALAIALRKLNASLLRQTSEMQKVQIDMTNLYAERDEAWRKAEELERELDAVQERADSSRPKSESTSRRSSRVSLARKTSLRASKDGLRLSGHSCRSSVRSSAGSSLQVHCPTSARTTFSSDIVPPVPPLPTSDTQTHTGTSSILSSRPSISMPRSSTAASNPDNLYNVVYDLLGVESSDRDMPSPRPRSEVYYSIATSEGIQKPNQQHPQNERLFVPPYIESSAHLRSGSLPTLIPPPREAETGAIIAMLDLHD